MKQLRNFSWSIPKYGWILTAIVFVGAFLRVYHFSDWLLFKGDAFRDAILASNVYRVGIESLPLLGPRAGGTMLHLGPIFYSFQYVAVSLLRSLDAPVLAYPDLLFSILTIPLFFYFLRRYFSVLWSLAMTAMLAVSFLAVEYGRFGWNPNSTLFFTLIFSYAVLRVYENVNDPTAKRSTRMSWAFVAGVSLAIASQLHFSAFLGLPLLLLAFVVWHFCETRKVWSFPAVALFLFGILLIYTPVCFSEYMKHGENTRQFILALSSKSSSQGVVQNGIVVAIVFAKYFLRISLGIIESGKSLIVLAGVCGVVGLLANVLLLRDERDETKRNFLQWTLLMMVTYFFLYIPLADKIDRPRFFLPFMILPYVYFGYVFVYARYRAWFPRLITFFAVLGIALIIGGNVFAVVKWFSELRASQHMTEVSDTEKNTKGKNFLLTWGHFERATVAIEASCAQGNPVLFFVAKDIREYGHSLEYALLQVGRPVVMGTEKDFAEPGPKGCYFFISLPGEILPPLITKSHHDTPVYAGGIQIVRFFPSNATEEFTAERTKEMEFVPEKRTKNSRVYWGDVFEIFDSK